MTGSQGPASPPGDDGPSRLSRRRFLLLGGASVAAVSGTGAFHVLTPEEERIPLYSEGVALGTAGERILLPPAEPPPRTGRSRVLPGAVGVQEIRALERSLLERKDALVDSRWHQLTDAALLDLNALSHGLPAPVAGWTSRWRYVWPRDAAHVIRVMADLGEADIAVGSLAFLSAVQRTDGLFEARYRLDGDVPDERAHQADGIGWFLWAVLGAHDALPEHRAVILDLAGDAAGAALRAVFHDLDLTGGLPSATPDYWEVPERRTTLGTAAITLAGLQAAARLGAALCPEAAQARSYAEALLSTIRVEFGRRRFQRYVRGGGYDAALTFLLPPYVTGFEVEVGPLLDEAWAAMLRPAGGVSPGAGWKDEFISWTPETALFAQAYGYLDQPERATEIMAWLEGHRTTYGSLPEKVLSDGTPSAVAPLAWTCAVVCSTAFALG